MLALAADHLHKSCLTVIQISKFEENEIIFVVIMAHMPWSGSSKVYSTEKIVALNFVSPQCVHFRLKVIN